MSTFQLPESNQRTEPRLKLPAAYTLVRARVVGSSKYTWTGHLYDISASGMRFELDMPLEVDAQIEVRGMLPGKDHTSFRAIGRVVRLHSDAEDLGPAVMGMVFEQFRSPMDYQRLLAYLRARGVYENHEPAARAA
ncbi:MAG: PilZ domain-containing protein [Phycisphaerales bacterium JB063]